MTWPTRCLLVGIRINKVLSGRLQELRLYGSCETESPDAVNVLHQFAESYESADPRQWLFAIGKRGPCNLLLHLCSSLVGCTAVGTRVSPAIE